MATRTAGAKGAMTHAEKVAYNRGYQRGRVRGGEWALRLLNMLKRYRERLNDQSALRRCDLCSRWQRGHGSAKWGKCTMAGDSTAWLAEPSAWPDESHKRDRDLITHEHFGCTNWLPSRRTQTDG